VPTVSSKYIDDAIGAGAASLLKGLGYRKHGRKFYLVSELSTAHVRFQASQWNHADSTRFTINLGRYFVAIAQRNGEPVILDPLMQKQMHVGIRIGHLLPEQADHWWAIRTANDVPAVSAELVAAMRDYGLPYLNSVASVEGVAEFSGYIPGIGKNATLSKASALDLLGRSKEAEELRAQLAARGVMLRKDDK
jgi:Domain of unknown function (DUF4304)